MNVCGWDMEVEIPIRNRAVAVWVLCYISIVGAATSFQLAPGLHNMFGSTTLPPTDLRTTFLRGRSGVGSSHRFGRAERARGIH